MENNNRPRARKKTTAQGSVNVGRDEKVGSSGPVGGGQRPGAASGRSGSAQGRAGASGGSTNDILGALLTNAVSGKKKASSRRGGNRLLLLLVVVVVGYFLLRSCGGGGGLLGALTGDAGGTDGGTMALATAAPVAEKPSAAANAAAATAAPVSDQARDKRVTPLGGGRDTVTVMVYMCGTDLESKYGMGTSDLVEMTKATISDKVNVLVETGGCKKWKNNIVSSSTNQIYKVETGGLKAVASDLGAVPMTDPANLTEFIQFCAENYPAERNILILWDHGGGSLSGYGYDEKFASSSSMPLTKLDAALENAGCVFDWIGFDACLMATLETALVCADYADYMIASEESEPGTGWYYTDWLTALSKNSSTPTTDVAKILIDTFVSASCSASPSAQVTLSVLDLAELQGTVPAAFRGFSTSTTALLEGEDYAKVSNARSGVRQFAQSSRINQVDLIDLCNRLGTAEAKALAAALSGCVKYNKTTISRANGVSIYFPYESLSSMNSAVSTFNTLGIDAEYTKCIQSFASLEQGGQMAAASSYGDYGSLGGSDLLTQLLESYVGGGSGGSYGSASSSYGSYGGSNSYGSAIGSLLGSFTGASSGGASSGYGLDASTLLGLMSAFSGRSLPQSLSWMDTELVARRAESFAASYLDPARIAVTNKNGVNVLALTEEEWALVQSVELNVYAADGAGYIDLGLDNVFEFDDDGDLLLGFDGTWLTVNGHLAAYYLVSYTENADGSAVTVGRIPARLNGALVNLQVVFDEANPEGVVTGAYPLYAGETDTVSKGDIALAAGDKLEFLCDYYGADGSYEASYTLAGGALTVGAEGLAVANMALEGGPFSVTYRLTDIYGNCYWTPAV